MEVKPYKIPHPFRKLTKKLVDVICKDIKEGSTYKLASEANGITKRIFEIWRLQGEVDEEHEVDSLCAYMVRSLAKIRQDEVKWCRKAIKTKQKGHKGAEWTLEKAYWKEFGPQAQIKELAEDVENFKQKHFQGEGSNVQVDDSEAEQDT